MKREGPALEVLLQHLAQTPQEFLSEPKTKAGTGVHVAALIFDAAQASGCRLSSVELAPFDQAPASRANWLRLCAIGCWLVSHEGVRIDASPHQFLQYFDQTLRALAQDYQAGKYLSDPERREELARVTLAEFDLRPAGETLPQAQDRLAALSSQERRRIIAEAKAAEARAREIREALTRKAAAESADKYTRE